VLFENDPMLRPLLEENMRHCREVLSAAGHDLVWFFSRMALRHVHLFECRRSTFEDVLRESMITHTQRPGVVSPTTTITTWPGRDIPAMMETLTLPSAKVLHNTSGDMVLRIPATADDSAIMDIVESWPDRFAELGLRVSTGPVVLFRAEEFLLAKADGNGRAPLLEPHNVSLSTKGQSYARSLDSFSPPRGSKHARGDSEGRAL
jgi:hypothetical protein